MRPAGRIHVRRVVEEIRVDAFEALRGLCQDEYSGGTVVVQWWYLNPDIDHEFLEHVLMLLHKLIQIHETFAIKVSQVRTIESANTLIAMGSMVQWWFLPPPTRITSVSSLISSLTRFVPIRYTFCPTFWNAGQG